ncbi:MAG: DNA cytosine methyltransferase [Oscillospiraceae bacterium]|nr:DNA cytosine methyltransferase [Oscillospiraceae bacterium]
MRNDPCVRRRSRRRQRNALCGTHAGMDRGGVVPTMTGDHENRVTDYTAVAIYDTTQITSPMNYSNPKPGDAYHPLAARQHPPLSVIEKENDVRKYIIRRLTPLECCRLQGFPDWWTEGCERYPISMEHATNKTLFLHVNPTGAIEGKDSPKYKMWGNGIALPCALHVMQGVARVLEEKENQ